MTEIDEETLRDQLKAKRNSLQKEFHTNPSNTGLAVARDLIQPTQLNKRESCIKSAVLIQVFSVGQVIEES